jgi:hypothetical protein
MMNHQAQWTAPSPLWAALADAGDESARKALRRPALLRFATDEYMEEFTRMLETDASRMTQYQALPETWRGPSPEPEPAEKLPAFLRKLSGLRSAAQRSLDAAALTANKPQALSVATTTPAQPLKLYQPAHQRFYLVTACLVCRMAGMPDRALDTNLQERVSFVVRRLRPSPAGSPEPNDEYAFVTTPRGYGWQKIEGSPNVLIKDEEQLPMFAVSLTEESGRKRRIFGALIPVGKREVYMGAGRYVPSANGSSAQNATPKTARKIHFRMQVAEPWKNLLKLAADAGKILNPPNPAPPDGEAPKLVKQSREQAQTLSWLLLLDFADYLRQYLPKVWAAVEAGSKTGRGLNSSEEKLFDTLLGITVLPALAGALCSGTAYQPGDVATSMLNALKKIKDPVKKWDEKLEAVTVSYDREARDAQGHLIVDPHWPDFLFPLADLVHPAPLPPSIIDPPPSTGDESGEAAQLSQQGVPPVLVEQQGRVDKLVALVVRALPATTAERAPAPPLASKPVLDTGEGSFVIRCVYERLLCSPLNRHHLAAAPPATLPPLLSDLSAPSVLSEPTETFQLAGFFDPDAPARPIRIALPVDTSPAGLRKFDKNTAFMISDVLCGQLQRLKGITFGDLVLSVLPWPFHKDLSTDAKDLGPCADQGVQLGMICTFSLPIITICALILLMVIVLLFEFIFHWIPLFIMCFPLPGFKAKK